MLTKDEAMRKVQALLARAENAGSAAEAATSASLAQSIMDKYQIEAAMLGDEKEDVNLPEDAAYDLEDIDLCDDIPLEKLGRKLPTWKWMLAWAVGKPNACCPWVKSRGGHTQRLCMVGHPANVATCQYLYQYLSHEINRLAKSQGRGRGRTWANNFRLGAIKEIESRLEIAQRVAHDEMRAEASKAGALVRVESAIQKVQNRMSHTRAWMEKSKLRYQTTTVKHHHDSGGYAAGKAAGARMNLGGGRRAALTD